MKKIPKSILFDNNKTVNIIIDEDAQSPKRATSYSAGYDVYAKDVVIKGNKITVHTGLYMQPPLDYMIMLVPRSSFTKYNFVMTNAPGIGDPDYYGEYLFKFTAIPTGIYGGQLTYDEFPYKTGDRIGQMFLVKKVDINFQQVTELETYERQGGFGSTGA